MARFLRAYARTGVVLTGCQAAGISRSAFYDWQAKYPAFAVAAGEAKEAAADRLEEEMIRRATVGDRQPVYQGGRLVGFRRQRSDNLLMFALKGARPGKYKEKLLDGSDLVTLLQRLTVVGSRLRGDVVDAELVSQADGRAAIATLGAPPPSTLTESLEAGEARSPRSLLAAIYAGARQTPRRSPAAKAKAGGGGRRPP